MKTEQQMIEAVANALFEREKLNMGDAWYHPSETFHGLGSIAEKPWREAAETAIAAMGPFVREMVDALRYAKLQAPLGFPVLTTNPPRYTLIAFINMADAALESLPACWKGGAE